MNKQKTIIEKIKKLLALSKSNNEAEAALAAQKAQELLTQYNLSESDLEVSDIVKVKIYEGGRDSKWRTLLLLNVAPTYFTGMVISRGYKDNMNKCYSYLLIGKPHNVEIAKSMFEYLEEAITRISREKCKRFRKQKSRESFKRGMVSDISNRLAKIRTGGHSICEEKSLVVNLYETEKRLIRDYMNRNMSLKTEEIKEKVTNKSAFFRGLDAGKEVGLNDQVSGAGRRVIAHSS